MKKSSDDAKLTPREDTPTPKADKPAHHPPAHEGLKNIKDVQGEEAYRAACGHMGLANHDHGWKPGPLPGGTYHWGGVVKVGMSGGFYFADFCGDHVKVCPGGEVILPDQVAMYNNCLRLPPGTPEGTMRAQ